MEKEALPECGSAAGLELAALVLRWTREFLERVWNKEALNSWREEERRGAPAGSRRPMVQKCFCLVLETQATSQSFLAVFRPKKTHVL